MGLFFPNRSRWNASSSSSSHCHPLLRKKKNTFSISPTAGHERYLTEVVERSLLSLLLVPLVALIFLLVWKVSSNQSHSAWLFSLAPLGLWKFTATSPFRSDHGGPRATWNRTPQTMDSLRGPKGRRRPRRRIQTRRKSEYLFVVSFF